MSLINVYVTPRLYLNIWWQWWRIILIKNLVFVLEPKKHTSVYFEIGNFLLHHPNLFWAESCFLSSSPTSIKSLFWEVLFSSLTFAIAGIKISQQLLYSAIAAGRTLILIECSSKVFQFSLIKSFQGGL